MQHWRFYAILLPLVFAVLGGAHWYVSAQLIRAWGGLGAGAVLAVRAVALALALSFPLAHLFIRAGEDRGDAAVDWLASVWLGTFFYILLGTLLLHGAWALARAAGLEPRVIALSGAHPGRGAAAAVAAVALALGACGVREAARPVGTTAIEAPIKSLPAALDGFVIVQVSDIHFGPFLDAGRLRSLVERVNALRPDLVVLTGDLVDREGARYEDFTAALQGLRATEGVLAIAGNHDAMSGVADVVAAANAAGVRVLRDEKTVIAGALAVYGMDDPTVARIAGLPPTPLERVVGPEALTRPAILLHHRPTELDAAARLGIDLMLSGHTHRGQVWPLTYLSRLFYPCQYGSFRRDGTLLFVSRGVGTWGPPMRVGSPPEIVKITLRARGGAEGAAQRRS